MTYPLSWTYAHQGLAGRDPGTRKQRWRLGVGAQEQPRGGAAHRLRTSALPKGVCLTPRVEGMPRLMRLSPCLWTQVTLPDGDVGARARAALEGAAGVKDVHPERRLTRHLHTEPPPPQQGRRQTRPSGGLFAGDEEVLGTLQAQHHGTATDGHRRRRLLQNGRSVARDLGAPSLWTHGFSGAGVRMAVFDTGVRADHPAFKRIVERTNWTSEQSLDDGLGHGTFVAGVILGTDNGCPGFAPDAELFTFRVFTNAQLSYTSWFLDAFNYAIATRVHVLNLSIGGPDYLDQPFVDKVNEITANGIVMVSAIGNDGPLWGTLNNPADQMDVIGVGGISFSGAISGFSSRGSTTGELVHGGAGRFKPDIMAFGDDVLGSRVQGGCRPLSGTSVASPVVAGAVVLLASTVAAADRSTHVTPASMKQALVEGAQRLQGPRIWEQGAGKLDLNGAYKVLSSYTPRASALPAQLHLDDCPYMWPFCTQPLYAGAQPVLLNVTLLNGQHVTAWLTAAPTWTPSRKFGDQGKHLDVQFTWSTRLWPWSGWLGVALRVKPSGATASGTASGIITLTVASPNGLTSEVSIPLRATVKPTPVRGKRVLWSQWHNIPYPPGYIPRDDLDARGDILDWHGDSPVTNYHDALDALVGGGYSVESLREPLTCVDLSLYGTLLLWDTEEEFTAEEVAVVHTAVTEGGLSVFIAAEWYHVPTMQGMRFFDDNTHSHWTPYTGGSNVPALNDLLAPFGAAYGDRVMSGTVTFGALSARIASGANLARMPANSTVHVVTSVSDATSANSGWNGAPSGVVGGGAGTAVLGLINAGAGRLALWGDTGCLDSSHSVGNCNPLLLAVRCRCAACRLYCLPRSPLANTQILRFTGEGHKDASLFPASAVLTAPLATPEPLPQRRTDVDFGEVSKVMPRNTTGKWSTCMTGPLASRESAAQEAVASPPPPSSSEEEDMLLPLAQPKQPAMPAPSVPATGAGGDPARTAPAAVLPPATPSAPDRLSQRRELPPPAPAAKVEEVSNTEHVQPTPRQVVVSPPPPLTSVATLGAVPLPAVMALAMAALLFLMWRRSRRRGRAAPYSLPQVTLPGMQFKAQSRREE